MKINMVRVLSASLVAGLLLASCGGGDEEKKNGGGGGANGEPTTVVVWDRAGAEATVREKFFEEWNKNEGADLGIKVDFVPQATERYEDIVRQGFQTQRGPDIFHSPSTQMGGYVGAGWVQPLDGLVDDKLLEAASQFMPENSELIWGGRPYAIPTTTFTVRTAINRDLFTQAGLDPDDPPTTFSEVEEASRAIVQATDGEAYGVALPLAWVGFLGWTVDIPLLAADADLAQTGLFDVSTGQFRAEDYQPIIEHFRTLLDEGLAYPGAETMEYDGFLSSFAEGKVGMVLTSGSIVGGLRNLGTEIDFGVGPIVVPDGTEQVRSPMNAGFPVSISSTTEHVDEAVTVFEVLVGADMQAALAEGGIPPLLEEAWESEAVMADDWLQMFRPTDADEQWPKKPGSVVSIEGQDAATTVVSLIMADSPNIEKELSDLSQRYQTAYETGVENGEIDPSEFGL